MSDEVRQTPEESALAESVTAAVAGSPSAYARLVERYQRPLFRFLVLRTGDADEADELVQDVFVRAWCNLARYDPRHPFGTWLFTIAHRRAVDSHRRRARTSGEFPAREPDSGVREPSETLAAREQQSNLWTLAGRVLGDEARAALWLRHVEGLDVAQVARVLGRSRTSVRVLVHRARRTLAAVLGDRERAEGRAAPERAADAAGPDDWYPLPALPAHEVPE